jgi:hypothetical protein
MNDTPATRLHQVVVVHEQSGAAWNAGRARIRDGYIVVPGTTAPARFFEHPAATYRVEAIDGANRIRRYPNLVLISSTPKEYVFD